VVVHNGIITNYAALREMLQRRGYEFESETDTEVIPKLAKCLYDALPEPAAGGPRIPFLQLVQLVVRELEGAYALIFKSRLYPGELVAAKRGSPLLLAIRDPATGGGEGLAPAAARSSEAEAPASPPALTSRPRPGQRRRADQVEFFLASDASAVIEHTKKVMVLEDDDLVHLARGAYAVYRLGRGEEPLGDGCPGPELVTRVIQTLEMEVEQIRLGKWGHFMAKEIHEQPDSLRQTMRGRVVPVSADCPWGRIQLGGMHARAACIHRSRRLLLIACGTSFHGCLAVRALFEEMTELPVQLELASDFLDRRPPLSRGDTCVFVSQSGETADTLRALEYAREASALCVGVTNTVGSAISRGTDCGIHLNAGAEIGVASTKAYTSQIVALVMMALLLGEDSASKSARRRDIIGALLDLPAAVAAVLQLDGQVRALAQELAAEQSMLVFGRGWNYSTALEAALKVKEVAIMHSEGILAGEMKHGPLALVDSTLPLLCIATSDAHLAKMESVCEQLRAREGRLILLLDDAHGHLATAAAASPEGAGVRLLIVPRTVDCLQPVLNAVPLQLLSYHLALLRGHNVDRACTRHLWDT
jgi:glucosamine--fructose-6-phosphate aminotransferase (isomerizing)